MNNKKWKQLLEKAPHAWKLINHNPKYNTKEKQLAAVKQNGYNIQYIPNPDKDVQLIAVKQDGKSIQHIPNPDKDVVVRYLLQVCPDLLTDPSFDLDPEDNR